jgi:uncharacterized protein (DUF1800 family)
MFAYSNYKNMFYRHSGSITRWHRTQKFFHFLIYAILGCVYNAVAISAPGDISGDSKSDLIFRNTTTGQISAWLMNGAAATAQAGLVGAGSWTVTHVADFNGDGKADILFRNDNGSTTLWLMNGLNVMGSVGLLGVDPDWRVAHVGDFNGDGKADILWRHTNGAVTLWLMDGITVTNRVGLLGADPGWSVSHIGDFNGDGKADLLWQHTNGAVTVWLMSGAAVSSAIGLLGPNPDWRVAHVADFNGDGKADLLWRNINGAVSIWLMNGASVASAAGLLGPDANWSVSHTGDFNGDGKADLLWRHTNGAVTQWLMSGTSILSATGLLGPNPDWRVTHLGDYNGDGKADFVWRNTSDGSITMWIMNGATILSAVGILGASPWIVLPSAAEPIIVPSSPQADAARFLTQATFGPNMAAINEVTTKGYARWIEDQFVLPLSNPSHWKYVVIDKGPKGDSRFINSTMESFWQQAVRSQDQLRQRMTFALSEIFVVSTVNSPVDIQEDAHASYLDMLSRGAFGNYRTLLEDVSIHPTMGIYLSWFKNEKEVVGGRQPDENYAREVMQLFSIGLWQLNLDGTRKTDANGKFIPTYSQDDIKGMAKVFTGWSWGQDPATNDPTNFGYPPIRWDLPMQAYPDYHSMSEKRIINGVVIPANTGPKESLRIALDTLFNHPNVGPFFGSQLIKRFVTSNPSPAYVTRVASAFNNNGAGVRGDMKAVMRAILLDVEARSATVAAGPTAGKLREPIVRFANFMRAFDVKTSPVIIYRIWNLEDPVGSIGQNPLRAPSVFNWYRPDYAPPGAILGAGLVAPEFQITHETTVTGYTNFVTKTAYGMTESVRAIMANYGPIDEYLAGDVSAELALADQPDALIDRLNLLLLYGKITPSLRNTVRQAINNIPLTQNRARDNRVAVATALIMASPQYVVLK